MKIATFNVNSIRARITAINNWVIANKPDVLCLQETKVADPDFPTAAITTTGYHVIFRGEKSYNGVAILSKARPTDLRFGVDDGQPPDATRLIAARFGPVHIVNTYVPQGRAIEHAMYQYKLKWFKRLRKWFDRNFTPTTLLAWVGDLNVAPEAKDIHNADKQANHVCYHQDVRKAFEHTKAWGFEDIFRKHHQEDGQYTFFDYRTANAVKRNMGWRIDHILTTRTLAEKSRDSYIDLTPRLNPQASDHTVLVAEFKDS